MNHQSPNRLAALDQQAVSRGWLLLYSMFTVFFEHSTETGVPAGSGTFIHPSGME